MHTGSLSCQSQVSWPDIQVKLSLHLCGLFHFKHKPNRQQVPTSLCRDTHACACTHTHTHTPEYCMAAKPMREGVLEGGFTGNSQDAIWSNATFINTPLSRAHALYRDENKYTPTGTLNKMTPGGNPILRQLQHICSDNCQLKL